MHTFKLLVLGSNAALPAYGRHPTAQVLNVNDKLYLIDCGECAQIRMSNFNVKRSKINQIFISHLHGDHYFGLVGVLTSYSLMGRQTPLHIYGPEGLQAIVDIQTNASKGYLGYDVFFHSINTNEHNLIFENEDLFVYSVPMDHGIACCGFCFVEKQLPNNILKEKIIEYNIPIKKIPGIKLGDDLELDDGTIIPNNELTKPAPQPRSYMFCSDTAYNPKACEYFEGVDLLYHETTFTAEDAELAKEKKHSTTHQAAKIAKKADVGRLLIGHFSARYKELDPLKDEARQIFPNTDLAMEGIWFEL